MSGACRPEVNKDITLGTEPPCCLARSFTLRKETINSWGARGRKGMMMTVVDFFPVLSWRKTLGKERLTLRRCSRVTGVRNACVVGR